MDCGECGWLCVTCLSKEEVMNVVQRYAFVEEPLINQDQTLEAST